VRTLPESLRQRLSGVGLVLYKSFKLSGSTRGRTLPESLSQRLSGVGLVLLLRHHEEELVKLYSNRHHYLSFTLIISFAIYFIVPVLCCTGQIFCYLQIRIRIRRIGMFLGLPDLDPDPLVRGTDPDPDPDPSLFSKMLDVLSGLK
jgi:hypothetical protein